MSRALLAVVVAAAMIAGYALSVASDLFAEWAVLFALVAVLILNALVVILDRLTKFHARESGQRVRGAAADMPATDLSTRDEAP